MAKRLLALFCVLFLASACSVNTPFDGPGFAAAGNPERIVVGITHITLKDDSESRDVFWRAVARIDRQLATADGFILGSKRQELFGDEAWTVTVWRDADSLARFISSGAHREAMDTAYDTFVDARFARLAMARGAFAPDWDMLLAQLDANARAYYE